MQLTDNWIELYARFLVSTHDIRDIMDAISRKILAEFEGHGIEVASQTFELARIPPVRVRAEKS